MNPSQSSRIGVLQQVHGWRPIAFELRFEDCYEEAREWLYLPATQDKLDRFCQKARASKDEAA
jgi:hypothetical protein